jgi:hypothetical protein
LGGVQLFSTKEGVTFMAAEVNSIAPEPASLAVWSVLGLVSLAAARRNKAGSQSKREARQ